MKKEKIIYLSKVFSVFSTLLLVFAYIFSLAVQITMPMTKTIQSSVSGSLLIFAGYIFGLMAISVLAQKLALRFIKKPDCV